MGKTPNEIKKGLECRARAYNGACTYTCSSCDTYVDGRFSEIFREALAYIQQLETERHQLLTRCERLERERDAAVADMRMAFRKCNVCCCCKHEDGESNDCDDCIGTCNWQWRGVCPENTKEENHDSTTTG